MDFAVPLDLRQVLAERRVRSFRAYGLLCYMLEELISTHSPLSVTDQQHQVAFVQRRLGFGRFGSIAPALALVSLC